jgi:hypothetical protein
VAPTSHLSRTRQKFISRPHDFLELRGLKNIVEALGEEKVVTIGLEDERWESCDEKCAPSAEPANFSERERFEITE